MIPATIVCKECKLDISHKAYITETYFEVFDGYEVRLWFDIQCPLCQAKFTKKTEGSFKENTCTLPNMNFINNLNEENLSDFKHKYTVRNVKGEEILLEYTPFEKETDKSTR